MTSSPPPIKKPSSHDTVDDLKASLSALGMKPQGKKETLLKMLKRAWTSFSGGTVAEDEAEELGLQQDRERKTFEQSARGRYKAFLVLDIEGTCESGKNFSFPNEIIEFPVVLVRWRSNTDDPEKMGLFVEDSFQSYVKPIWRPKLSTFCTSLTGIQQETVDSAPTFVGMLPSFEAWLRKHDLLVKEDSPEERPFLWVTDGLFDLRDFVAKQCYISNIPHPSILAGDVLDLKEAVAAILQEEWLARDQEGEMREKEAKEKADLEEEERALNGGTVGDETDGLPEALGQLDLGKVISSSNAEPSRSMQTSSSTPIEPPIPSPSPPPLPPVPSLLPTEPPIPSSSDLRTLASAAGSSPPSDLLDSPSPPAPVLSSSSPSPFSPPTTTPPPTLDIPLSNPLTALSSSPASTPLPSSPSLLKALSPNIDPSFLPDSLINPPTLPAPTLKKKKRNKNKRKPPNFFFNVTDMLRKLGLGEFEGRAHSGIDDARNIARILIELERRGHLIEPNRVVTPGGKVWDWVGCNEDGSRGGVIWNLPAQE